MLLRAPYSTLFPYTTLFRSIRGREVDAVEHLFHGGFAKLRRHLGAAAEHALDAVLLQRNLVAQGLEQLRCRSEEHTSELQSQFHLVCRLLLEKKKKRTSLPE